MRYCTRCKTPVENGTVCPRCAGTSFAYTPDSPQHNSGAGSAAYTTQAQPQPQQNYSQMQNYSANTAYTQGYYPNVQAPQAQNKNKNIGIIIGAAAGGALLFIIIAVLLITAFRSTPEKTVRKFENAFNDKKAVEIMELMSYRCNENADIADLIDILYEADYELDIDVNGKYKSGYNEYTVYGDIELSDGIESAGGTCEFILIKENGKWKIDDMDFDINETYNYYSYDYDDELYGIM